VALRLQTLPILVLIRLWRREGHGIACSQNNAFRWQRAFARTFTTPIRALRTRLVDPFLESLIGAIKTLKSTYSNDLNQ
jgi:hypothetical protein